MSAAFQPSGGGTQEHIQRLAQGVLRDISELDPIHSKELLGAFVSQLYLSAAEEERREYRRQQQAEGIEAAKQRGVRFGRSCKPLPENFDKYRRAWRGGRVTLRQAAQACGMNHATFRNAVLRAESTDR